MIRDLTARGESHKSATGSLAGVVVLLLLSACRAAPAPAEAQALEARSSQDIFASPAACEQAPAFRPAGAEWRVASLNVRWFPDGHSRPRADDEGTDLAWLSCIIAKSGFDVLALQEFKQGPAGREALAQLLDRLETRTGARYSARLDECPENGRQHVGFLWNTRRARLDAFRQVDDVNPLGGCRGRLRPGLEARAHFASGPELRLLTVHLDSGRVERDFAHRQQSFGALRRWTARPLGDAAGALLLGDFNTMGCGRCELPQDGESEVESLDHALPGRLRLPAAAACSEYYRGRAGLLDHAVFVSPRGALEAEASVLGPCASRHCARAPRSDAYLTRVSDHCPVLVTLTPPG